MQGNYGKFMVNGKKMMKPTAAVLAVAIILTWLFCLPRNLFSDVPRSTVVIAADGTLLGARVAADGQWRFPPCDSVPEKFAKALIEYEDRSFFTHCGISLRGVVRALKQNISNGRVVSGASTITMQTIRLSRRSRRTVIEKIIEMFMATRLESRYSKAEILKMYVSNAPFGGNVVGIDAAVWRYLGNDGSEMSWAEAATLAVLQNAPSAIHLSKNRGMLQKKRDRLLRRLYDKGDISRDEYELSVEEPLIGQPIPMPSLAPHLVEHYHAVRKGLKTITTIDCNLQRSMEEIASMWRSELSLSGVRDLAVVVASVASGDVIGYCGNADLSTDRDGKWVDIARSPRSSGSILKPLLYCAAIQEGLILENTLLPDVPTDFGGFAPKNFDGNYAGVIPANEALALSLNVPNVYLLKKFGVSRFASLLHKVGLTTISPRADEYGLSLVLGGCEVTLLDIVNCYTALLRQKQDFPLNDSLAVYSMLNAMLGVSRPDGLDYNRVSSVQNVAWKTGTSYGARDGWAIGLTPGYVVGVWVGNADGTGVADLTGARMAGPVMFDVFNLLPPSGWFERPEGEIKCRICRKSGHIAGKYCVETDSVTVSKNSTKSQVCPYCREIPVSLDGSRRVTDFMEPAVMKSFFVLPPLQRHFYTLRHADYVNPPVDDNDDDKMQFIYPSDGAVISLPRNSDGYNRMICKVAHSDPSTLLYWHVDQYFAGVTSDIHQLSLTLSYGCHRIAVVDSDGSQKSVEVILN